MCISIAVVALLRAVSLRSGCDFHAIVAVEPRPARRVFVRVSRGKSTARTALPSPLRMMLRPSP